MKLTTCETEVNWIDCDYDNSFFLMEPFNTQMQQAGILLFASQDKSGNCWKQVSLILSFLMKMTLSVLELRDDYLRIQFMEKKQFPD